MEEDLSGSSITEDHRALMVVVLQGIQSVDSRLIEAFNGLLTGFKVSHVILFFLEKVNLPSLCNPYKCSSPRALGEFEKPTRGSNVRKLVMMLKAPFVPYYFESSEEYLAEGLNLIAREF